MQPGTYHPSPVLSGTSGADCSFHFITGQRYLVDTRERIGALFTGTCILTRPERIAQVELETLRRLATGQKSPDVMGSVGRYVPGHPSNLFDGLDPLSFPTVTGITVNLQPVHGGQRVSAQSDAAGRVSHGACGSGAVQNRVRPAADLIEEYLDTRIPEEFETYKTLVELTDQLTKRAFSNEVIAPGKTTVGDVRRWLYDQMGYHDVMTWFQPDIRLQRKSRVPKTSRGFLGVEPESTVILPGDVLHLDFGITCMA